MLPTQRLSPKNQVTLPREARALMLAGPVEHIRGMKHAMPAQAAGPAAPGDGAPPQTGTLYPVLLLMTEPELQRREQRILDDPRLSPEQRLHLVTALNGEMAAMAIDAQNRVVIPAHLVRYLELQRDVFFVCTNTTIQVWNPEHYLRWSGRDTGPAYQPALNAYLMI